MSIYLWRDLSCTSPLQKPLSRLRYQNDQTLIQYHFSAYRSSPPSHTPPLPSSPVRRCPLHAGNRNFQFHESASAHKISSNINLTKRGKRLARDSRLKSSLSCFWASSSTVPYIDMCAFFFWIIDLRIVALFVTFSLPHLFLTLSASSLPRKLKRLDINLSDRKGFRLFRLLSPLHILYVLHFFCLITCILIICYCYSQSWSILDNSCYHTYT